MLNLKWVSDVIGDEHKDWKPDDTVLIDSQTGTGKTHFIVNKLVPHVASQGKKLLYLCNRTMLKDQVMNDLMEVQGIKILSREDEGKGRIGCVDVKTYQSVGQFIHDSYYQGYDANGFFDKYDYIVYDECHYFIQDSSFNTKIDFLYKDYFKKESQLKGRTHIFISATMETFNDYVLRDIPFFSNPKTYSTGRDYSYIIPYHFKKIEHLIELIRLDNTDSKWFIVGNMEQCITILEEIEDSSFKYSNYRDYNHPKKLTFEQEEKLTKEGLFDSKCLVSTKVLDNGINLKDSLLTNIVIFPMEKVEVIQILGRKRIDINNPSKINVHFKQRDRRTFRNRESGFIKMGQELIDAYYHDKNKFFQIIDYNLKIFNTYGFLFHNEEFRGITLNLLGVKLFNIEKDFILDALDNDRTLIDFVSEWLDIDRNIFINVKDELYHMGIDVDKPELVQYIDSMLGQELYSQEQQTLTKFIIEHLSAYKIKLNKYHDCKKLQVNTLKNIIIDDSGLPYEIIEGQNKDKDSVNFNKRYIIFIKK